MSRAASISPCGLAVLLAAVWCSAARASEVPANTWQKVQIDWKAVLAAHTPDGRWDTTDGYSDNVYRSKTGEILIRTGIESKALGTSPGYYTNTTVKWDPKADSAAVEEIAHWGGGSYGGGKLLPAFQEHPTPSPRHTYDGICYVEPEDAVYLVLGANWKTGLGDKAEASAKEALAKDNKSLWKYAFAEKRWTRIEDGIASAGYTGSPYENHLTHWPQGEKLLFLNDGGNFYAEFDLKSQKWEKLAPKNKCPMRVYNARSAWDSKRALWVFRLGEKLCTFNPASKEFAALPDCWDLPVLTKEEAAKDKDPRRKTKGVCYISKHDVYLVIGPTGNDTRVFDPHTNVWKDAKGGELPLVNGYLQYDPSTDCVLMNYQLECFRFRYVP
ncbi:MAG: hypothetical protein AMXMBFR7_08200 [Planctomycetota bacterium]